MNSWLKKQHRDKALADTTPPIRIIPPIRSKRFLTFIKKLRIFLITLFFLGFLFAQAAPDDILTHAPLLQIFVDWMKSLIPSIGMASARSNFPQVTEVYFSFFWFFSPLLGLYNFGEYQCVLGEGAKRFFIIWSQRPTRWTWMQNMLYVAIATTSCVIVLLYYDGRDFNILPFNSNRFALGIGGWIIPAIIPAVTVPCVLIISKQIKWFCVFFDKD